MELAQKYRARLQMSVVNVFAPIVEAFGKAHAVRIDGLERLPEGPVLLVGNHGLLGYETPFFFFALYQHTGEMPLGLADRWFFKVPIVRDILVRVGGTYGCRENALAALRDGKRVVCYPGGAREALKGSDESYQLQWGHSRGFIDVAAQAGVPIVPFAAAGVDDTFDIWKRVKGSGRWLMGHDKYDLPVPTSPMPKAVPLWFRIGDALAPGTSHADAWKQSQTLLDGLMTEWRAAA